MAETAEVSIPASARGCKLRCVACGTEFERAAQDFRCVNCGELLEVFYPAWEKGDPSHADELRTLWLERRKSLHALDQSGVWRFRELLPGMMDWNKVITLREGNTPIFELPRCAKSAGVRRLRAKHQGMNPTGSFKDTGMTAAISVAVEEKFRWVLAVAAGSDSAAAGVSVELGESLPAGRAEDGGYRTFGAVGLVGSRSHCCAWREFGKRFCSWKGAPGDEGGGADLAASEGVGDSGGRGESAGAHDSGESREIAGDCATGYDGNCDSDW